MKHVRYNLFVVGLFSSNRFCGPVEFGPLDLQDYKASKVKLVPAAQSFKGGLVHVKVQNTQRGGCAYIMINVCIR